MDRSRFTERHHFFLSRAANAIVVALDCTSLQTASVTARSLEGPVVRRFACAPQLVPCTTRLLHDLEALGRHPDLAHHVSWMHTARANPALCIVVDVSVEVGANAIDVVRAQRRLATCAVQLFGAARHRRDESRFSIFVAKVPLWHTQTWARRRVRAESGGLLSGQPKERRICRWSLPLKIMRSHKTPITVSESMRNFRLSFERMKRKCAILSLVYMMCYSSDCTKLSLRHQR